MNTLLKTSYYDIKRFKTQLEAHDKGEIYQVKYMHPKMFVIDPDDNQTALVLNNKPFAGLDPHDHKRLVAFLDEDMKKRKK